MYQVGVVCFFCVYWLARSGFAQNQVFGGCFGMGFASFFRILRPSVYCSIRPTDVILYPLEAVVAGSRQPRGSSVTHHLVALLFMQMICSCMMGARGGGRAAGGIE